ncbi:Mitochondrial distribution and morphology protein 10 [Kickxella alabastrina]|uniref:Mitochondrial distribution and morphology protein 10 n=1 Tax=Kickxella alabastrina TaxID=61397 RepID=A0ACC1IR42_9FUNG|nr:Mitochondrial distribution and morphology protein 10 [Kickxella alabastrina]
MFTAPDYFPFLIRQFHRETRWDEHNSYSTFCKTSQAILDFSIPHGVSVSAGRSVSSGLNSQLVFSMIPSKASSIGYLAASRPLFKVSPLASRLGSGLGSDLSLGFAGAAAGIATSVAAAASDLVADPAKGAAEHIVSGGVSGGDVSAGSEPVLLTGFSPSLADYATKSDVVPGSATAGTKQHEFAIARQQQVQDERDSQNLLHSITAGTWKCNWDIGSPQAGAGGAGDYLMVAQMYPSLASITGSYIVRRSATSELTISGVSVAGSNPDMQFVMQHATNRRRWSSEAILATSGKLVGLRGQYNFGDVEALDRAAHSYYRGSDEDARRVLREKTHGRLSVGSEVYFGAQESSGGISVGARYRYDLPLFSELTCVLTPIMGHLSLAWTQQLRPQFCAAARYDFNMFSLDSELAMGMEWQLDQNSIVKTGWSRSQGLRFLVDTRLNNMIFSMGLAFNSDGPGRLGLGSGAGSASEPPASSSSGMRRLVRSFGLQFQWFL